MVLQPIHTLFAGQNLIELQETASTNDLALELLKSSAIPEGTAILTQHQTKGRGQRSQSWESEAGKNITTSFILYPRFLPVNRQFSLSIAVALGVLDFLEAMIPGIQASVKWPNDIYAGRRKVCGILIENTVQGHFLNSSVIGIGINVNQTLFGEDVPNAASLNTLTGHYHNIRECFRTLCECLEPRYLQLKSGKEQELRAEYLGRLFQYGELCDYLFRESPIRARISGISELGKLQLETEREEIIEADLKEIRFIL